MGDDGEGPPALDLATVRFIADDAMGVSSAKVLGGTSAVASSLYNELGGNPWLEIRGTLVEPLLSVDAVGRGEIV